MITDSQFTRHLDQYNQAEDSKAHIDSIVSDHLAKAKVSFTPPEIDYYLNLIQNLLRQHNAVLIAHYYTAPEIQKLAEQTGGFVGDSLEMARFGSNADADTLIVCGVRFMGETAKIISPNKTVLMPTLEATCSLDIGCPVEEFSNFCSLHSDRVVVVYANTSAAVKARADWVVTSSIAVDVIDHLDSEGKKILWAPDRYLGSYVQQKTGADMVLWNGSCIVHEEFKEQRLLETRAMYPGSAILVHPESPAGVIQMADVVGSTSQLIQAAIDLPNQRLIVATDQGIFYKMQQAVPDKELIIAPTAGNGATCRSCANCPWMGMNNLELIANVFGDSNNEIKVDKKIALQAKRSLQRMLDFKQNQG